MVRRVKNVVALRLTDTFGRLHNSSPDGGCHGSRIRYWHGGEVMCQFFYAFVFAVIFRNSSFFMGRVLGRSFYKAPFHFDFLQMICEVHISFGIGFTM